jgi:hypothetical protein
MIRVTPQNWRQISDRIHSQCMEKMGVARGSLEEVVFLGLALGGEAGEMNNIIKKMWRDGQNEETARALPMECADVMIYMDHLLNALNVQVTAIICAKLQELVLRWPEYFKDWKPVEPAVH